MSETNQLLETLQADVLGVLQNTPALALANLLADNEGDIEARVVKALSTLTPTGGKNGLAVVVLLPEVVESDRNLPGPPLTVKVEIRVLENVLFNRAAATGTLMRSSQAALTVLSALQLRHLGHSLLVAEKDPLTPVEVKKGHVSHAVTLYAKFRGLVTPRPSQVQVSLAAGSGDGIAVTGTLTSNGSTPLVFPATIPSAGTANGRPTYYIVTGAGEFGAIWKTVANPFTGSGDFTGWFLQEDGDGVTWASTADVATPDLVPAGAWHANTNPLAWRPVSPATGTPVVAASGASTITLTCASPSSSIRYTTDGSYPSPAKTLYTGPFALPAAGTVIRAAAYVAGMPPSDILEFTVTA